MFVRTDQGRWNNLSRASAISVEPDRQAPDKFVVLAHYSGSTRRLRNFATEQEAQDWAGSLIEGLS